MDVRLQSSRAVLVLCLVAAVGVGCSSGSGSGAGPAQTSSPPGTPTSAAPALPTAAVPPVLQGDWVATVNPRVRLRLEAHAYALLIGGSTAGHGDVASEGKRLAFFNGRPCGSGTGWYAWTLQGSIFELRPTAADPCDGRAIITRTWRRAP